MGPGRYYAAVGPTPSPNRFVLATLYVLPVVFSENFDSVTPPALPPDWEATILSPPRSGSRQIPECQCRPADTPPNAAFIDDPALWR